MNGKSYAIYKQDKIWIVESKNGDITERSEHSSRIKALLSFFARHAGIKLFYVTIPNTPKGEEK